MPATHLVGMHGTHPGAHPGAHPDTWLHRARLAAASTPGAVLSHGTAARLHGLAGFERCDELHVLCRKGRWPDALAGVVPHATRAALDRDVEVVAGLPTLTVGATLALLTPAHGVAATALALDGALRGGQPAREIRAVARRLRQRGRAGPNTLELLLDERDGRMLPHDHLRRIAGEVQARHGVRLVHRHASGAGVLDLADPRRRVGLVRRSWDPASDARLDRPALDRAGWTLVDLWWHHLHHPHELRAQLDHALAPR